MTEEPTPDPLTDPDAPPAAKCLLEYLNSKQAAKPFLASLEKGDAQLPDVTQREVIVEATTGDVHLAARLGDLVRLAAADETPGRIRKALTTLGSEYIRAQSSDLRNWSLIATSSPETDLGMLARHVRRAREARDKVLISAAEQALTIGMAIISTRPDFDIVGATSTLAQQLHSEPLEVHVAEKSARKAFRRASLKNLETYSAIGRAHAGALEDCRKRAAAAFDELQNSRADLRSCRDARAAEEMENRRLHDEVRSLNTQLDKLRGRIDGVKGGAADDITRLKARIRQFFLIKLQGVLSTADEALSLEPPSFRVARERVRDVLNDVRKELEWLDQS